MNFKNFDLREKYRPKRFSESVGNEAVIKRLKNIIKSGLVPRGILFQGPAGSGKTTFARLVVKALHCQNFTQDICGVCDQCLSFEKHFPGSNNYSFHDCTKLKRNELDNIIRSLQVGISISPTGLHIHIFDEFNRTTEPLQEKFLIPLEVLKDILLFFCLIDDRKISRAFRSRVQVFETKLPEVDNLVHWQKEICDVEGIIVRDSNALREIAEGAKQSPRECLSILQQAYFLGEPLSTSLVRELLRVIKESLNCDSEYVLS